MIKRSGHARADDAAPVEYLYVPCARTGHGRSAQPRRWVQAVPVVRKTAKWIYYTSDTWDRAEAVVSPGCISRQEFETDTRYRADRRGYPAGVIPVPGARPGSAGRLFFATRQAAEHHLHRGDGEQAGPAARDAAQIRTTQIGTTQIEATLIKALRRAMADAHPDRGGTAEQFIQARRRYETVLGSARR
jgi:hypothetical protein